MDALLRGGPYNGAVVQLEIDMESIGLGLDENLNPDQTVPPFAMVMYRRQEAGSNTYVCREVRRTDGKPFEVEYVGGPIAGLEASPLPARADCDVKHVPLGADGHQSRHGEIESFAIYKRTIIEGRCCYQFQAVSRDPKELAEYREQFIERTICQVAQKFYDAPDYGIYSLKPNADHAQVKVQCGRRRGEVDEKIAPLIYQLWKLGLDTAGSCQQLRASSKSAGKAYVGFYRANDGRYLLDRLTEAGISAELKPKKQKFGYKPDPNGPAEATLEIAAANVLFDPADIERITELLSSIEQPVRP